MPFSVGSRWLLQRAGAADQTIEVDSAAGDVFTAHYVGTGNPSIFNGETYRRQGKILYMKQGQAANAYHALHIGVEREPDVWGGYWCGVGVPPTDEGEFKLSAR